MRSENFVAFFTVSGFFMGLSFSLLKSQNLFDFIFYVVAITLFFYLLIHLVLIFFYSVEPAIKDSFEKLENESVINHQVLQLKKQEKEIDAILKSIKNLKS